MTIKTPYAPSDGVKIPNLDPFFGPDAPPLPDPEPMPDGMQQNPHILYVMQILADVLTDRLDTFADTNTIVYYDPTNRNRRLQQDIYVAFDVDAGAIRRRNGYLIWEVGKPPDFVLEVASRSTGRRDTVEKRVRYAELGIAEYWRFDETGEFHGVRLAGDRLVDGRYEPIEIDDIPDGSLQGHSTVLNVDLRWADGQLHWHDPATGERIASLESEREGRIRAQARAAAEQRARAQAEERAGTAEARVRELEDQLNQLRGE